MSDAQVVIRSSALLCAALALLALPPVLSHVVSLKWRVGDIRLAAYGVSLLFTVLALAILREKSRLCAVYDQAFPTRRDLKFAALALLISMAGTLAVVEVGLRALRFPFSGCWIPSENAIAQFDRELGWSYLPNQSVIQKFGSPPVSVTMHFNGIGARVGDPRVKLSAEDPSILFVGGSFTMGHGLEFEETFIGRLQAMENFPFQVVNLGVQGFGTDQSLLQLRRHCDSFNTKAVVYTFMYEHVLRNANYDRRILFPDARFIGTKPLFGLHGDGTLYLQKRPRKYEEMTFFHLWGVAESGWARLGPEPTLDLTNSLVLAMKEEAESRGAKFIVIDWDQKYSYALRPTPFSDLDVDLLDTRKDAPEAWRSWIIPADSHPNAVANAYVSERVYHKLQDNGLISSSSAGPIRVRQ